MSCCDYFFANPATNFKAKTQAVVSSDGVYLVSQIENDEKSELESSRGF